LARALLALPVRDMILQAGARKDMLW